jgi:EAL domain-containing protein (putative c-di-GMP-specific phosphodiesterase class I)
MKQAERAARTLDALRELGTTIAIDDFGTGYSSLSYLKRFPVDRLKIDRSFVRDIPEDANDIALAKAIVALGHSLNLSVVAEGVETQAQRELLTSIGCDEMQGFLYSAPRTASELASLLSTATRSACVND